MTPEKEITGVCSGVGFFSEKGKSFRENLAFFAFSSLVKSAKKFAKRIYFQEIRNAKISQKNKFKISQKKHQTYSQGEKLLIMV